TLSAIGLVIGSLSAFLTVGFVGLVEGLNQILLVHENSRQKFDPVTRHLLTFLVLGGGGLMVGLIIRYGIQERRPLGPPDTIYSVQLREPPPDLKSGFFSTLASVISLGCGASVGQYGPLVYLGTLTGQLARRLNLKLDDLQSIAIACGVAAAISTAFNAPIAGLIFTHEVILRHYSLRMFTAVTIASACGYVVANVVFHHPPLFLINYHGEFVASEFFLFAIEGIACGLIAVLFMKALAMTTKLGSIFPISAPFKPMLAGFILSTVATFVPEVLGAGQDVLRLALIPGSYTAFELWGILTSKLVVTVICIGFGFAGGVIFPSLLVGILFGAFFATTVPELLFEQYSGLAVYAVCGMVAVASPVIGAPITALLIIFELTRNYEITIAAMVTLVFANLIASHWYGRSLFDTQLIKRGLDLSFGRDRAYLQHLKIIDFQQSLLPVLQANSRKENGYTTMQQNKLQTAVVTDQLNRFLGLINQHQLLSLSSRQTIEDIVKPASLIFDEKTNLWQAMESIRNYIGEAIPVVHSSSREYLGTISEAIIINAYLDAIHDLRREEYEA
ncbi:MAG: CIC family chloride channel protein, partial [Gammaproteobacteria bacterium]